MPGPSITLDVRLKFWELAQACAFVFLRRYWIAVAGVTLIVFLETAGTWLLVVQGKLPVLNPYYSFWFMQLGYLVLVTSPLRSAWRADRAQSKQASFVYTLDREGISAPTEAADLRTSWSGVRLVQETRRHFLVHATSGQFWILPKRCFSRPDVVTFRELTSGMCVWRSRSVIGLWF